MSKLDQIDKYELNDGTSFSIAPGWGCNVFSWRVNGVELMYCPPGYPAQAKKITDGGNPILFPSVGRTWDRSVDPPVRGEYRVHGSDKTYFMPNHGTVFFCEFRKVSEETGADCITATYELVVPERVREENYPFDVGMVHSFTLTPTTVELKAVITNNGPSPAPVAFGWHPYFKISNAQREGVEVRVPVTKEVLLGENTNLPTGETVDTDGIIPLKPDVYYDNAFGCTNGRRMSVIDRKAGRSVHVDFGDWAEIFLVYTPDGTDFVCIEPWSKGIGEFEQLKNPGWETTDQILVLRPGQSVTYDSVFSVEFGTE
jgi:galactose mutarotase-like enzyme